MADKFSIDDIISEYSEKVENDLKTDESQENDEILNEDTNIDESIEKDNDTSDIDSDGYDPIKATDFDDELAADHTNEKKRNEENAALINNLTKHKKGKADALRGKITTKISREITIAVRMGGADPTGNMKLKLALSKAKANNIPKDNIQRAIQKGAGALEGQSFEEITYEGYGPAGVAMMVSCLTDNRNRTAADVRHVFSKHGGNLGASGCVSYMFKQKGIFAVSAETGVSEDDLMMIALDAGAEDIKSSEDGFEIITDPAAYDDVEKALADNNIEVAMSEITMVPDTMAELSGEDAEKVQKMLDALDDCDDVQDVYTNADLPEDDEE